MVAISKLLPNIVKSGENSILKECALNKPKNFLNLDFKNLKLAPIEHDIIQIRPKDVSSKGIIADAKGEVFNAPYTLYARGDVDWPEFGGYLNERFKDASRVNFYQFGSSFGDEAYTSIVTIDKHCKSDKFLPIKAFDINHEVVESAKKSQKSQSVFLSDVGTAQRIFNDLDLDQQDIKKYFSVSGKFVKLKPEVTQSVKFSHGNILDEVENIDNKYPTVFMCRNMWPYVNSNEYDVVAEKMYNQLKDKSIAIIGEYDNNPMHGVEFATSLKKAGFIPNNRCTTKYSGGPIIFEKQ